MGNVEKVGEVLPPCTYTIYGLGAYREVGKQTARPLYFDPLDDWLDFNRFLKDLELG